MAKVICDRWEFDDKKRFYIIVDFHGRDILVTVESIITGESATKKMDSEEFEYGNARESVVCGLIKQVGLPALNDEQKKQVLELKDVKH